MDVYTERLDNKELNFVIKKFGVNIVRIDHIYSAEDDGSPFCAETVAGPDVPILGLLLNWLVLRFSYSKKTAEHWIRHNVEETRRSQSIIPVLYKYNKKAGLQSTD